MSLLARAVAPRPIKRVTVSEDGTYAVGPTLDSIAPWLPTAWQGVSPETALNLITVYQCVRLLSNTFAQIPLLLYRRLDNGGKERATEHPMYNTLHLEPAPGRSSFAWRRLMMVHLATWGNAYSEIVDGGLGVRHLYPIRPDRVEVSLDASGEKVFDYLHPTEGKKRFRDGTVFHVAGLSTDGLVGRSPISDLRSTIRLARTAEEFGDSFFRNGARPATVLKHPGKLSDPAVARLGAQMEALRGSGNAGKTVVLEEGLDFGEIGVPPEDAQFMETRLFQKREIAGAYGIPLHKIGDLERATFSNIEHQAIEFIQDAMMPYFVNVQQEITIQLTPDEPDLFAEFLIAGYLQGDTESEAKALQIMRNEGIINGDEWRAIKNMNPIEDGSGKAYWMPVNYQSATVASDEQAGSTTPAIDDAPSPALFAVKSFGALRCPDDNTMIVRVAPVGAGGDCRKCKKAWHVTENGVEPLAEEAA